MSLVTSNTAERLDFQVALMDHYADGTGVHCTFGDDTLQGFCNSWFFVREWLKQFSVYPGGVVSDVDPLTQDLRFFSDSQLILTFCGKELLFQAPGPLLMFDHHFPCSVDGPQDMSDLADAIVQWCAGQGVAPDV